MKQNVLKKQNASEKKDSSWIDKVNAIVGDLSKCKIMGRVVLTNGHIATVVFLYDVEPDGNILKVVTK